MGKSRKYNEEVKLREYKVLAPFMHFKKDDIISLVLKLNYDFDSGRWDDRYYNAQSRLVATCYDTILPPKALYDKDFFENVWSPYMLSDFMKSCNVKDYESLSASVNVKLSEESEISKTKDFITELWFKKIQVKDIINKYK